MSVLKRFYHDNADENRHELCIDEVGRGCLFGRVYIACVVLPKDIHAFDGKGIKDSKKFSSKKKMKEMATYIKENALAWNIAYLENDVIDDINILKAVMKGMHIVIHKTIHELSSDNRNQYFGVIDGNYFQSCTYFDSGTETIVELPYVTVEKGDSLYMGIAAASILAKTARDEYILDLCEKHPALVERYGLNTNMGYGTKAHMEGIKTHGITEWHRKSYSPCSRGNLGSPLPPPKNLDNGSGDDLSLPPPKNLDNGCGDGVSLPPSKNLDNGCGDGVSLDCAEY